MASGGDRFSAFRLFALIGLVLLGIATLGVATSSPPNQSAPSPSAEVDLICHTDNPADCYPRIFQPSDEFQIVREDQELPAGLHVRLNLSSGKKEAKINVPGEQDEALEGLPVDSSVVVVESEQAEDVGIPAGAPAYDAAGQIKKPVQDTESFYDSLKFLKKGLNLDEALESLEDISHDIYYGLMIAEEYDTVESLFCLANNPQVFEEGVEGTVLSRARVAALTIAGAVQNHPKALSEVEKHWQTLRTLKCPGSAEDLGTATFRLIAPRASDKHSSNHAAVAKARASAIRGLIKSPVIRKDFLESGGMEFLLDVLVSQTGAEWEPVQRRVALLVQDNFLDESMGAALGEWPRNDQATDHWCKNNAGVSEGCWDWELKRLVQQHRSDKGHWSVELGDQLSKARKALGTQPRARVEL
ncbi:hypothetical protein QBC33DRAFT_546801 [Phialemonium atrogriseum]|uniref:Nucleotide exchange factor SIL1 n=1 Tax=Phialemonium atrogriseum TaxID=1093897 RepID=A0AAJ0BWF6_9PEZI|nr:uncharacterized protein QBC33DRAFT_546801 [Phialemonium atrogriseum]KAK1764673.1 hypothetical protein QBC33DRAFT_546801 [Phialemonium atrogriseum]